MDIHNHKKRVGKERVSLATKFLFTKKFAQNNDCDIDQALRNAAGKKPHMKVITRNGVDVYITVDKRAEYSANKLRLMNYEI